MVCGAPVSRSSGGRSAVARISGTRADEASTTAGKKFAAALPDVQTRATGRREALASPRAKNPAARSSRQTWVSMGERSKARARGAERDPEQITASRTPAPWRAATNREAQTTLRAPVSRALGPSSVARSRVTGGSVARDRIQDPFHLELGLVPFLLRVRPLHDPGAGEDTGR